MSTTTMFKPVFQSSYRAPSSLPHTSVHRRPTGRPLVGNRPVIDSSDHRSVNYPGPRVEMRQPTAPCSGQRTRGGTGRPVKGGSTDARTAEQPGLTSAFLERIRKTKWTLGSGKYTTATTTDEVSVIFASCNYTSRNANPINEIHISQRCSFNGRCEAETEEEGMTGPSNKERNSDEA